eukprot:TRINITY_DN37908_c0_g1_i1.p1 TRINITY_DN37908_c0_g1~~TRINITY_DN37908_c0_g1_i1.p1  ORF type:complete len:309 (-),score=51.55 TRINITY_DN37908_c0_g1_i1:184-1110(-)
MGRSRTRSRDSRRASKDGSRDRGRSRDRDFDRRLKEHQSEIQDFCDKHKLDERVHSILAHMHPKDVRRVISKSWPRDTRNPTGFVVSVVRKVEEKAQRPAGYRWDFKSFSASPPRRESRGRRRRSRSRSQVSYSPSRSRSRDRDRRRSPPPKKSPKRSASRSMPHEWRESKATQEMALVPVGDPEYESQHLSNEDRASVVTFFDGASAMELLLEGSSVTRVPDSYIQNLSKGFPHGFRKLSPDAGKRLLEVLSNFQGGKSAGGGTEQSMEVRHAIEVTPSGRRIMKKSVLINGKVQCVEEKSISEPRD